MKFNNILIVGAHYDDTELGAGGTAAKLAEIGKKVYKLTLTNNETDFKYYGVKVDQKTSQLSSEQACQILGMEEITDFKPAMCNELVYSKEMMQQIEAIVFDKKIDAVFMHFRFDINQDHLAAYQLCLTAARHCKNLFAFQSNNYICEQVYNPVYFIDISKQIEKKKAALSAYGSEHNRFNKLFETKLEMNHVWGAQNHVEYAEGFHVIKMLDD